MTVTPAQIGWSAYKDYEGPFFHGVRGFKLPVNPDTSDKYLAVITAAEGGHYDAINMYDRGIISVGVIQWIEAGQYSVSDMLGHVADKLGVDAVMLPLKPALDLCDASFKKNAKGRWRFFFNDVKGEVDSLEKTRILFLGCTGLKGSWTPEAKQRAKTWAACVANVWSTDEACRAQNSFTRPKLLPWFVLADGKAILFGPEPEEGWVGALRAAFVSFGVNLPSVANAQLKLAVSTLKSPKWSAAWCTGVLKQLTFGPNIGIYPLRYNGIRPVLEQLWNVSLPKTAKDLQAWQEPVPTVDVPPEAPESPAQPPPDLVTVAPEPTPEPPPDVPKVTPPQPEPTPEPQPGPIIPAPLPGPSGILGFILWMLQTIFSAFTRSRSK